METNSPWIIEGSSKARLVSCTPEAEETMAYIARVTSKDQENPNFERLLKYCLNHKHFSVFEQSFMTVEIVTPLAISVQLLRHSTLKFQQYSGRYEDQQFMQKYTDELPAFKNIFYIPEVARDQDVKNRQNSMFSKDSGKTDDMWDTMSTSYNVSLQAYNELLSKGIAKEVARFVLPQGVYSRLYATGSCRSWIHYIQVREDEGVAQHEHVELARCIKTIFSAQFPTVYKAAFEEPASRNTNDSRDKEITELKAQIQVLKAQISNKL